MTNPGLDNYVESLRSALVEALSVGTWEAIELDHRRVELAWREDLGPRSGKPKYLKRVLAELGRDELMALAGRCIQRLPDRCRAIQDAVWWLESNGLVEITELTRGEIADSLDGRRLHPRKDPVSFISKYGAPRGEGHYLGAPMFEYGDGDCLVRKEAGFLFDLDGEWEPCSHRDLLETYGFFEWPDRRVCQFLESLVHPTVRQGNEQAEFVDLVNEVIGADGFEFAEIDSVSGKPVIEVRRRKSGVSGRPKNLIFASSGMKPELGFRDAINNDVVILKHGEHCLVYDKALNDNGLLWEDLVEWWAGDASTPNPEGTSRRALGARLRASLQSPPEQAFFSAYFRLFKPLLKDKLPALIPQVYLHFDTRTLRELRKRGEERRFLAQRMDFLLLLPGRVRVVVEIDGQQHYAEKSGHVWYPSPTKYAETMMGDRELRLDGYEVYRFGADELRDQRTSEATLDTFVRRLLERHRIVIPPRDM